MSPENCADIDTGAMAEGECVQTIQVGEDGTVRLVQQVEVSASETQERIAVIVDSGVASFKLPLEKSEATDVRDALTRLL